MATPYEGNSGTMNIPGIKGTNNVNGDGVFGFGNANGRGVVGVSEQHTGCEGNSTTGAGVWGFSLSGEGVHGESQGQMAGIAGVNIKGSGPGIWGESTSNEGVHGVSHGAMSAVGGVGVGSGTGVWGDSQGNDGVHGISHSPGHAGVSGANDKGGLAGFFQGNVTVTGAITVGGIDLANALKQLSGQVQALQGEITNLAAQVAALRG
jgi:hypothetical protein